MKFRAHVIEIKDYCCGQPGRRSGLSIGVARNLPRMSHPDDRRCQACFDVWLPALAPSRKLLADLQQFRMTAAEFATRYRAEMNRPAARQLIQLLAAIARFHPVHVGCFCPDAARCHRSVLRQLIEESIPFTNNFPSGPREFFSPACAMPEIDD